MRSQSAYSSFKKRLNRSADNLMKLHLAILVGKVTPTIAACHLSFVTLVSFKTQPQLYLFTLMRFFVVPKPHRIKENRM